jgi:bifunctional non-homologous end joining protein LigD
VQRKNLFIEPCVATLKSEPPAHPVWVHEVKFDGYRIQIHKDGRNVALYSRQGNDFTARYPSIAGAVAKPSTKSVVLNGELCACDANRYPSFAALLHRRDVLLCVWIFDILSQHGKDLRPLPLMVRRRKLETLMHRVQNPFIQCSETFSDPQAFLAECRKRKFEGIVSKRIDRPYTSGRSGDWIKVKCAEWREETLGAVISFKKRG